MYELRMTIDGDVLHAEVEGQRSSNQAEMAADSQSFWYDIVWECQRLGLSRVLVVARLTGWVSTAAVLSTHEYLQKIVPASIERIAYVDLNPETVPYNRFAQELSRSGSFEVGIFDTEAAARSWLDMG